MLARTVGNQMYVCNLNVNQADTLVLSSNADLMKNRSLSLKKIHQVWQLLKAAKHLPIDFLESINFEIFSVRKMGSSISIKAKEDFLKRWQNPLLSVDRITFLSMAINIFEIMTDRMYNMLFKEKEVWNNHNIIGHRIHIKFLKNAVAIMTCFWGLFSFTHNNLFAIYVDLNIIKSSAFERNLLIYLLRSCFFLYNFCFTYYFYSFSFNFFPDDFIFTKNLEMCNWNYLSN